MPPNVPRGITGIPMFAETGSVCPGNNNSQRVLQRMARRFACLVARGVDQGARAKECWVGYQSTWTVPQQLVIASRGQAMYRGWEEGGHVGLFVARRRDVITLPWSRLVVHGDALTRFGSVGWAGCFVVTLTMPSVVERMDAIGR